VLDGDPATPQKGAQPQFSAHVYCGQKVAHLSYCWELVLLTDCQIEWSEIKSEDVPEFHEIQIPARILIFLYV